MSLRNKIIDKVCDLIRGLKKKEFEIKFRTEYGTPEENTRELLEMVTRDFSLVRDRDDDTNLFMGRFFGIVLLIESKLESLLVKIDPTIEAKMLGRKISIYKKLIKELSRHDYGFEQVELEVYQRLLKPLGEISKIRNKMAHDLSYTKFRLSDIPFVLGIVKDMKPNLFIGVRTAPVDIRPLILISIFGFIVSEKTSVLSHSLE